MRKIFYPFFVFYFLKSVWYVFAANPIRTLMYVVITVVLIVELFAYYCITYSWNTIACRNIENCTRILLVADPQLIGLHNEPHKFLTPISIWDSDRYLAKTFSHAFKFTEPDVIIFLGDLFDEGSTANDEEFKSYYDRLIKIFSQARYKSARYIWLPGDNDIGGEGNDWITEHKAKRFEQTFQQQSITSIKNIKFYHISELTNSLPEVEIQHNLNNITVGLSHTPLIKRGTSFVEKVLQILKPDLLFTAHTHEVMIYKGNADMELAYLMAHTDEEEHKLFRYNLGINKTVYEMAVPTCSYRMGTDKIGYGFAVIEDKLVNYTVLWSPRRFLQFRFYTATLGMFIFLYLISVCKKYLSYKVTWQRIT